MEEVYKPPTEEEIQERRRQDSFYMAVQVPREEGFRTIKAILNDARIIEEYLRGGG